jgi:hypothetical protein
MLEIKRINTVMLSGLWLMFLINIPGFLITVLKNGILNFFATCDNKNTRIDIRNPFINVPDHEGGRPIEVNACILITHMVYL